MDKYSKRLRRIPQIIFGVFCMLFGVFFIILMTFFSLYIGDIGSMLLLVVPFGGGFILYNGINRVFFDDKYVSNGLVMGGRTILEPVITKSLLKRRKIFGMTCFIAYIVIAGLYFIKGILDFFIEIKFSNVNPFAVFAYAGGSIFLAFVFYNIYKKAKLELETLERNTVEPENIEIIIE